MKKHFEQLRNDHIADYQRLFNRVSLNLGSTAPEIKALPTDVQLRLYTEQHQSNPELEAHQQHIYDLRLHPGRQSL